MPCLVICARRGQKEVEEQRHRVESKLGAFSALGFTVYCIYTSPRFFSFSLKISNLSQQAQRKRLASDSADSTAASSN